MLDSVFAPFTDYAFMRRALVAALLTSVSSAPLGVLLVLRRMSLMGDAMSHAILPGVAIGFVMAGLSLPAMSIGGVIAGLVVALASGLVTRFTSSREDANLAGFYLSALACGVLLISHYGSSLDLMHLLFGSVLAIDEGSLQLIASIMSVTLAVLAVIYRPLIVESFDPHFMRAVRGRGAIYQALFLVLVVLNLVAGFQAMGTLMSVGLMILPAVTARFWVRELFPMMVLAAVIAMTASVVGLFASYHLNVPSGPAIILLCGASYLASLLLGSYGSVRARYFPLPHLKA